MTGSPSTDLEYAIAEMIASVKIRTKKTEMEISEDLGKGPRYLTVQKSKRLLRRMPADDLQNLAAMAGKKMTFV